MRLPGNKEKRMKRRVTEQAWDEEKVTDSEGSSEPEEAEPQEKSRKVRLARIPLSQGRLYPLGYGGSGRPLPWKLRGDKLGSGEFGTVYEAVPMETPETKGKVTGRFVAKVFPFHKGFLDATTIRETQSMAALKGHPNVPRLVEVASLPDGFVAQRLAEKLASGDLHESDYEGHDRNSQCTDDIEGYEPEEEDAKYETYYGALVMDHAGDNFADATETENGAFVASLIRKMVPAFLSVLTFLHECGIAIRDIKNDNICLTQDGIIKVIDFGWSKRLLANNTPNFNIRDVRGPETASGKSTDYDTSVDVYGLAASVYESIYAPTAFGFEARGEEEESEEEDFEDSEEDLPDMDHDLIMPETMAHWARTTEEERLYHGRPKSKPEEVDSDGSQAEEASSEEEEEEELEEEEETDGSQAEEASTEEEEEPEEEEEEEDPLDYDPEKYGTVDTDPNRPIDAPNKRIVDREMCSVMCADYIEQFFPGEGSIWYAVLSGMFCPNPNYRLKASEALSILEKAGLSDGVPNKEALGRLPSVSLLKVPAWPHPKYTDKAIVAARNKAYRWLHTYAGPRTSVNNAALAYAFELCDSLAHESQLNGSWEKEACPEQHPLDSDRQLVPPSASRADCFDMLYEEDSDQAGQNRVHLVDSDLLKDPEDPEQWKFFAAVALGLTSSYLGTGSQTKTWERLAEISHGAWSLEDLQKAHLDLFRAAQFCVIRARSMDCPGFDLGWYYDNLNALHAARLAKKLRRNELVL